jgi:hypothetical protein
MDYTVYEDSPRIDIWMRLICFLPALILLAMAALVPAEEPWVPALLVLLAVTVGVFPILLVPVRLSILNSAVRIGFRLPFALLIPFSTVVALRPSRWSTVGINLPSNLSQKNAVEIVRRKRMSITITPSDKEAFLTGFDKAFKEWQTYEGRGQ